MRSETLGAGLVTAGNHLRVPELDSLDVGERNEDLDYKNGERDLRLVPYVLRQREVQEVVDVPASRTVRHGFRIGWREQRVLRHAVAVFSKDRLRQAGEGLARDEVAEGNVVLEHPHQAAPTAVISGSILGHRRVVDLAFHGLPQGTDLIRFEHGTQVAEAVGVQAVDQVLGLC